MGYKWFCSQSDVARYVLLYRTVKKKNLNSAWRLTNGAWERMLYRSLLLHAWRCIYSLLFWYACMGLEEAPPAESCISSLSISCSELLLLGLRLWCPAVSSGARIKEGAQQLPNLSAADEKIQARELFFFFLFTPSWPCFTLHVYSNFKKKKPTHWKGFQWEMASFIILTVSRACVSPTGSP